MSSERGVKESDCKGETVVFGEGDGSYQAAGGLEGLERLADRFYAYMGALPEAKTIFEMHGDDVAESSKKLAYFLSGWLGGPKLFSQNYYPIRIPMAHKHLNIGEQERDAWLLCMEKAVAEQPYSESFKGYLLEQLYVPAERIRQACAAS